MSITDPNFGEDDPRINPIGEIFSFGSGTDLFANQIDSIISGRNLINDLINSDIAILDGSGNLSFGDSSMDLGSQIEELANQAPADVVLDTLRADLGDQAAEIMARENLTDQQKALRIASLANEYLRDSPADIRAEVMTQVWGEMGVSVDLTAQGFEAAGNSAYGAGYDEQGLIAENVSQSDAGGGGSTSSAATPTAEGGGAVVAGSQANAATSAASAAAEATANDPNSEAAAKIVEAAMAKAQDVGTKPELRDTFVDPDGTVWMNTGPSGPFDSDYNNWRAINPSDAVIAQYEADTGQTYDPSGDTFIVIRSPEGIWPTTGTSTPPTNTSGGTSTTATTPTNTSTQNDGLLSDAASVLGTLGAILLGDDDSSSADTKNTSTTTNTVTTNDGSTNDGSLNNGTTNDGSTTSVTPGLKPCPDGQMRSPFSGNCVIDYSEVDFTSTPETSATCGAGTKLAGQLVPADGNCNPDAQNPDPDPDPDPESTNGNGGGLGTGTGTGTGSGTGDGAGEGDTNIANFFNRVARTPLTLQAIESSGLDYELTPLLSRVLKL